MSQAKVDRYKQEKANRKENMAKQKAKSKRQKALWSVVGLVFVAWIGFSAFDTVVSNIPRETVEINYTAITNYVDDLSIQ